MKQKMIMCIAIMLWLVKANAQTFDAQFITTQPTQGDSLKKYMVGVWVEDEYGKFVCTLLVYTDIKKELVKWYAKSTGSTVNAINGATLSTTKTHYIDWDCRKFNGAFVPLAKYKLCLESSNGKDPETYFEIPFSIFYKQYELKPADKGNFSKIEISFTPKQGKAK